MSRKGCTLFVGAEGLVKLITDLSASASLYEYCEGTPVRVTYIESSEKDDPQWRVVLDKYQRERLEQKVRIRTLADVYEARYRDS